jgi:hypothetical protein
MRVIETATGRDLGERIDRARFGAGSWMPDGKSFLYNRLQKLPDGAPSTDMYQKSRVYWHILGADPNTDRPVFGYGVNPNIKMETAPLPFAFVLRGSNYVFATVNSGVSPNSDFYIVPLSAMSQSVIPWRKIASLDDDIANLDIHGDDLYLLTYKNTPRYKVIHVNLADPICRKRKRFSQLAKPSLQISGLPKMLFMFKRWTEARAECGESITKEALHSRYHFHTKARHISRLLTKKMTDYYSI